LKTGEKLILAAVGIGALVAIVSLIPKPSQEVKTAPLNPELPKMTTPIDVAPRNIPQSTLNVFRGRIVQQQSQVSLV
jgi:hypothetical protein